MIKVPVSCIFKNLVFSGRDGLTHNMLDNIHAHWKRRRVCKIKCKGVCTVDMDNVRQQLEVGSFYCCSSEASISFQCMISFTQTNQGKRKKIFFYNATRMWLAI